VGVALIPLAHRRVVTQQQHAQPAADETDERHDEGDAPRHARRVAKVVHQRVVHGRHDEVSDAAAGVSPSWFVSETNFTQMLV